MVRIALILALGFSLVGCRSTPSADPTWWNPGTWFSGSAGRSVDKAHRDLEAKDAELDSRERDLIKVAQGEILKTETALKSAPASRPVAIATDSAQSAGLALGQAVGPISKLERIELERLVEGLLSENEEIRIRAEATAASRKADLDALVEVHAKALAEKQEALEKLAASEGKLRESFDRENALANKYRNAKFLVITLIVLSLAGFALSIYFRVTGLNFAGSVVRAVDRFKSSNTEVSSAPAVEDLLDWLSKSMNDGQKKTVKQIRAKNSLK